MMFGTYCRLGVHVHASNRTLIKAIVARLKRPLLRDRAGRARRHALYRALMVEHADARALYHVATGAL